MKFAKICEQCGKDFEANRRWSKYCSDTCRHRSNYLSKWGDVMDEVRTKKLIKALKDSAKGPITLIQDGDKLHIQGTLDMKILLERFRIKYDVQDS